MSGWQGRVRLVDLTADTVPPGGLLLFSNQSARLLRGDCLQQRALQCRRICAYLQHCLAAQAA